MRFWQYVEDVKENQQNENSDDQKVEGSPEQSSEEKSEDQKEESQEQSSEEKSEDQKEESPEQSSEENGEDQKEESPEQSSEENGEDQKEESQEQSSEENGDGQKEETPEQSSEENGEDQKEETQEQSSNEKGDGQKEESQEPSSEEKGDGQKEESPEQSSEEKGEDQKEESPEQSSEEKGEGQKEESPEPSSKENGDGQKEESQEPSSKENGEGQKGETQEPSSKENGDSQKGEGSLEQSSEEIQNESQSGTLSDKKEKLQQLRDVVQAIADEKKKQDESQKEEKKEYQLNEQTNSFLEQLSKLPPFEDRDKSDGYSIDTNGYTEIPDSVIRTLITKFLNQRFCKKDTDLNVRSNSLEKSNGFYKWEVKDVITHLQTHQITKVLSDKYGYEYANGRNENVPLSFYFDMSGSMSPYTNMLAVIAIELLKKNVKVLVGFNEKVKVQIDEISKNVEVAELADLLDKVGYQYIASDPWHGYLTRDPRFSYKLIDKNLDTFLISKKAEKCVVFADLDPIKEVINLSNHANVYWFCFERILYGTYYSETYLKRFNGFLYKVSDINDIADGLIKVNEKRFSALCYTDNIATLQKHRRET